MSILAALATVYVIGDVVMRATETKSRMQVQEAARRAYNDAVPDDTNVFPTGSMIREQRDDTTFYDDDLAFSARHFPEQRALALKNQAEQQAEVLTYESPPVLDAFGEPMQEAPQFQAFAFDSSLPFC